jgi:4'-phosphopantetheinyl transferase
MNTLWLAPANHPPIACGEAHIWAMPLNRPPTHLDMLAAILSPEERQRAQEFRLAEPQQRFVITRGALRVLLGRYLDAAPAHVSITVDSNNKPRLANSHTTSDLRFNVAHSNNLALIAMTNGYEIGVDVERLREVRHAEHIARRYFHPNELAAIAAARGPARDATFLRCWTGKEAVLKALGVGIAGSLNAFHVPFAEETVVGETIDVPTPSTKRYTQCWMRWLDPDDDYSAAVAVVGPQLNLRCMTFTS